EGGARYERRLYGDGCGGGGDEGGGFKSRQGAGGRRGGRRGLRGACRGGEGHDQHAKQGFGLHGFSFHLHVNAKQAYFVPTCFVGAASAGGGGSGMVQGYGSP